MKMSPRETVLVLATGAVALFGGSALLGRSKIDEWKDLNRQQAAVRSQIEQDKKMLVERPRWQKEFQKLRGMLPQYPLDKKMDVHWLSVMDELAKKHGINITQRQVGEEKRVGDIYELPIECKDWDGQLDAMVHFLFDLQAEGAMLDVRQMMVKPKEPRTDDSLRGRVTLYCAYTRAAAPSKAPPVK